MANLWRWLFAISPDEAAFDRRGFADGPARGHLEAIGRRFVAGYVAALDGHGAERLPERLHDVPPEHRGFYVEGAAMACALLDVVRLGGGRLARLSAGPGRPWVYLVHVGAGFALPRLARFTWRRILAQLEPDLVWLAYDGHGFHDGYFASTRAVGARRRPRGLRGYALRAYDQGLGRSLWFSGTARAGRIADLVGGFAPERHGDLWSGVGLAAVYAGGADAPTLHALAAAAGAHRGDLMQGAAFAAEAHLRAGVVPPAADAGCRALCGLAAEEAAGIAAAARPAHGEADEPAYELWRRQVRRRLLREAAA